MADFEDLEKTFYAALNAICAGDSEGVPDIRISWPTDGAPSWKIDDNVIFLSVVDEGNADIAQMVDSVFEDAGDGYLLTQGITRVLKVTMVAYGPKSYYFLSKIRLALLNGCDTLRNANIFLVPSADSPQRAPELFQGRWWERCDLALRFNSLAEFTQNVNAIKEADITVKANEPGASTELLEGRVVVIKNN